MRSTIVTLRTALLAVPLLLALPATSVAVPIIFTYDCTTSGTPGQSNCAGGPTVAQVKISETTAVNPDPGGSAVLLVEARLQFSEPQNPPSNEFTLNAIWLNIDELLLGNLADSGLPFVDVNGPNDYNTLLFDFDGDFSVGAEVIRVEANSTTATSWKNFDLGLCKGGTGQAGGSCALDLPIVDVTTSPPATPATQPWTTLGYLNSGNGYDLQPEDFAFLTTNSGVLNYPSGCTEPEGDLASQIDLVPATSPTLNSPCLNGQTYGVYYGAAAAQVAQVPEPSTLVLIGVGLLGLPAVSRWSRRAKSNS